jgi:hypothetical protein
MGLKILLKNMKIIGHLKIKLIITHKMNGEVFNVVGKKMEF